MKRPLPQIRMIPTGGVTPETAGPFLEAGASALGYLVNPQLIEDEDYEQITAQAAELVKIIKEFSA